MMITELQLMEKQVLAFSENIQKRFEAYNWQVLNIDDVNDLSQIDKAVEQAQKETNKPTLIITKTHIGFGSPNKHDTSSAHGSPLGEEEVKLQRKILDGMKINISLSPMKLLIISKK